MTPNILFILTDDQRFDTIRALGNQQIHTPNMDQLVGRGTVFTHACIPGGTSPAVCMPSRAMIHTGRGLFEIDGQGASIPDAHTTLGQCLGHSGYETFGTGKWHNGCASFARSFTRGGEIFFGGMADHWNVPCCDFDPEGEYPGTPHIVDPFRSNQAILRSCDHITPGKHSTELVADATRDFLKERDPTKPFFAYASFLAPHDPRAMPEKFRRMYDPDQIDLPANFLEQHPFDTGALNVRDELLAELPRQPGEIRRHLAEYYGMITHIDDAIGRIIGDLGDQGMLENTIVILAGDNGIALGQHGLMGKQSLYDHSVRVPLVFAGCGVPVGHRSDAFCFLSDIFPTLCELVGLELPESVTGRSLVADMHGKSAGPDAVYLAYCDHIRGVRDKNYKLVEYRSGCCQFFDLRVDPMEARNLANLPEHQDRIAAMRQSLIRFRDASGETSHPEGGTFWKDREDLLDCRYS